MSKFRNPEKGHISVKWPTNLSHFAELLLYSGHSTLNLRKWPYLGQIAKNPKYKGTFNKAEESAIWTKRANVKLCRIIS